MKDDEQLKVLKVRGLELFPFGWLVDWLQFFNETFYRQLNDQKNKQKDLYLLHPSLTYDVVWIALKFFRWTVLAGSNFWLQIFFLIFHSNADILQRSFYQLYIFVELCVCMFLCLSVHEVAFDASPNGCAQTC